MNKGIEFELVHTTPNYRVYKASREIVNFPRKGYDWTEELADMHRRKRDGVELLSEKCEYVMVSDATTHIERLVFGAALFRKADGTLDYGRTGAHMSGSLTFMIHGGDANTVKDDSVYLRHISIINSHE